MTGAVEESMHRALELIVDRPVHSPTSLTTFFPHRQPVQAYREQSERRPRESRRRSSKSTHRHRRGRHRLPPRPKWAYGRMEGRKVELRQTGYGRNSISVSSSEEDKREIGDLGK